MLQPGTPDDIRFAARLVVEGLIAEDTVRAVLAKQRELSERGRLLSIADICLRKGFISAAEARLLTTPEKAPVDLIPGLELRDLLGVGGMSRVYRATDVASGEAVAVKLLLPRLARDPSAVALFEAEARLLCRLSHENLVRGYYHFAHDGLRYLVMELVDGETALELLDRRGAFDEHDALEIILQAARALEYMHQNGLVHRDVKPGNILVGKKNHVKICDLGFAVASGGGDPTATTAGTAQYIAPEQAVGEQALDSRADIYALGVTLFQLTMGKLPFTGETNEEQLSKRVFEELRAKELKGIGVSQHLHYFIQKMMARERDVRYQTPADLIADIEESIAGRNTLEIRVPVRGTRPSTGRSSPPGSRLNGSQTFGSSRDHPDRRRP